MRPDYSEQLTRVAAGTLEQLAFIFSFANDTDPSGLPADDVIGARVTFSGPLPGELLMVMSSAALPELTSNMLGLEEGQSPPEDQQKDALREVLNVICGNLLPLLGGLDAVFDIQPPEVLDGVAARKQCDECRCDPIGWSTATLSLDEGECRFYLRAGGGD